MAARHKRQRSGFAHRFGLPGIISTIALIFAMTGGAVAAKYLITSTKQISPSVLKKLKGAKGATGAAGAVGAAGAQGPAGIAGAAGAPGDKGAPGEKGAEGDPGTPGTNGTSVKVVKIDPETVPCDELGGAKVTEDKVGGTSVNVCNGEPGEKGEDGEPGEDGQPWTPDNKLPDGAMLTGSWSIDGTAGKDVLTPISFPIPLAGELEADKVHFKGEAGFSTTCPGTLGEPEAVSGHLCVFQSFISEGEPEFKVIGNLFLEPGAGIFGAALHFKMTGDGYALGSWAVTGFPAEEE